LAVIDQQGRLVSATTAEELWPTRKRNGQALAAFLKQHEGPVPDAQIRLADALARAKREHKRVLVEQSASWCGWCHVLAKYFDRHRSLIEKDYIWIVVDPRFTHGEAVIQKLRPKAEGGIPWMVILDADGKPPHHQRRRRGEHRLSRQAERNHAL
jgi:thiol:disulfide interchange protein